jgi:ribonuclease P protein component
MISAKYRFHGYGSLKYLFKNANSYRSHYFTVKAIANPHRPRSRYAIIVSKKVHKSAVGRNRIRRRMYELLRHEMPAIRSSHDIAVIISSGEVLGAASHDLSENLRELLVQANVYR